MSRMLHQSHLVKNSESCMHVTQYWDFSDNQFASHVGPKNLKVACHACHVTCVTRNFRILSDNQFACHACHICHMGQIISPQISCHACHRDFVKKTHVTGTRNTCRMWQFFALSWATYENYAFWGSLKRIWLVWTGTRKNAKLSVCIFFQKSAAA